MKSRFKSKQIVKSTSCTYPAVYQCLHNFIISQAMSFLPQTMILGFKTDCKEQQFNISSNNAFVKYLQNFHIKSLVSVLLLFHQRDHYIHLASFKFNMKSVPTQCLHKLLCFFQHIPHIKLMVLKGSIKKTGVL